MLKWWWCYVLGFCDAHNRLEESLSSMNKNRKTRQVSNHNIFRTKGYNAQTVPNFIRISMKTIFNTYRLTFSLLCCANVIHNSPIIHIILWLFALIGREIGERNRSWDFI